MTILHDILKELKNEFAPFGKGSQRGVWFACTIIAIIIPCNSSKTSNRPRCLNPLFGFTGIRKKQFYTGVFYPQWNDSPHIRISRYVAMGV